MGKFVRLFRLTVLFLHAVFLLFLFVQPVFKPPKKTHKSLLVKTITPPKTVAAVARTAARTTANVQKQTRPAPVAAKKQQTEKKPVVKKEPAIADKIVRPRSAQSEASKTPPPQNRAKISDNLLKELEQSIAKMENKSDKPSKREPIVLQIDAEVGGEDDVALLIGHLQRALKLPEFGEVKIRLSLKQDGSVDKVIVENAQNEKNRRYLETQLPKLKFAEFAGKEHTFVVTFCNE